MWEPIFGPFSGPFFGWLGWQKLRHRTAGSSQPGWVGLRPNTVTVLGGVALVFWFLELLNFFFLLRLGAWCWVRGHLLKVL